MKELFYIMMLFFEEKRAAKKMGLKKYKRFLRAKRSTRKIYRSIKKSSKHDMLGSFGL